MGMFDDVRCFYPLPWPEAQGGRFQSKSTPDQYLSSYKITLDGRLYLGDDNGEWTHVTENGEIEIHITHSIAQENYSYSVRFWFRDGVVKDAIFEKVPCSNQGHIWDEWPALITDAK